MKKSLVLSLIGLGAVGIAQAQEVGRVISTTPVIQQYAVPRQVCSNQQVAVEQPKTGAGGVMGAIAGGAVGNQIGHGGGRAAATVLGVVGGALLGDRI
ncbi:MAG: glycine zipper 2TM domain-containing protein, partial [Ramlibacter sp.]